MKVIIESKIKQLVERNNVSSFDLKDVKDIASFEQTKCGRELLKEGVKAARVLLVEQQGNMIMQTLIS